MREPRHGDLRPWQLVGLIVLMLVFGAYGIALIVSGLTP